MDTLVIDTLPRILAFPFDERDLEGALESNEHLNKVGVFFLYTSGIQVDHYDPLTCPDTSYPILALDDQMPTLAATTRARLSETYKATLQTDSQELSGAARADAQLAGQYQQEQPQPRQSGTVELELCETACIVFPVKRRIRMRVAEAISAKGARAIRNWFSIPEERRASRKPLVLYYDEAADLVTTKFCEKIQPGQPRYYR